MNIVLAFLSLSNVVNAADLLLNADEGVLYPTPDTVNADSDLSIFV